MPLELPKIDYRSHPAYGMMFEPDAGLRDEALAVLNPLIDQATQVEHERIARGGFRFSHKNAVGESLVADGVGLVQLDDDLMDPIESAVAPTVSLVRERIAKVKAAGDPIRFKTVRQDFTKEDDPEIWAAVDNALHKLDVYELTKTYFGAVGAKLKGVGFLLNQPNQDWANHLFRDMEFETPATAGFHIDSSGKCFIKGVLYLNDVGPEQGPFGMIPESHRWSEGKQERIYRRAFDKSPVVSRLRRERQMFISLPEEMQVKAEFGGDMLPGASDVDELVRGERVCTGPRGQLNLFNPDAIHRGGNVRTGERQAILVTAVAQW